MYLISIYFDENTERRLSALMKRVADATGNDFMTANQVPPHITIAAFETTRENEAIRCLETIASGVSQGELHWVTVGAFFPSVIYLAPVLNEYLHQMSFQLYQELSSIDGINISKYYRPFQWIPHITIGKQLTQEQMQKAFGILQKQFAVFKGMVTKIGLAKTNPYEDIVVYELKE